MQGIEVLSKTEILGISDRVAIYFGISSIFTILLLVCLCVYSINSHWNTISSLLTVLCVIFTLISVRLAGYNTEPTGRYRYKCTIDDSVSFNEIYEKYNIIEQDRRVFIIEDKE